MASFYILGTYCIQQSLFVTYKLKCSSMSLKKLIVRQQTNTSVSEQGNKCKNEEMVEDGETDKDCLTEKL